MTSGTELATALRNWRDRTSPEAVGLPTGARRRAPGLRREDLAALACVSVNYLVRLEQGRALNPSSQVLAALARALRLSDGERDLLYVLAGAAPPAAGTVPRHVGPGIQRIIDRLIESPVSVYTASWDLLLANPLWQALFNERQQRTGRAANLIWRLFLGDGSTVLGTEAETDHFARSMISDLHDAAGRYPDDRDVTSMIADLRASSERFTQLWDRYTVAPQISERKTILSPTVGPVTVDCDILTARGSDLPVDDVDAGLGAVDFRVQGGQLQCRGVLRQASVQCAPAVQTTCGKWAGSTGSRSWCPSGTWGRLSMVT